MMSFYKEVNTLSSATATRVVDPLHNYVVPVGIDSIKLLEVERKLNLLNKQAVKSIHSEDGDIIDCVDIYKQPAFDHPGLRNHTIQMAILIAQGFSYLGARADIKVDNPFVESDNEYSTSQVSLKNSNDKGYEAIESGWAVNPRVYRDKTTRLFVYWTVDSSKTTGCFDLTCPGFVQTTNEVALGAAIYPISKSRGLPYQITVYISKDPFTGNWWVQYGDDVNIGYWPADLFGSLSYHAETVEWGGEVYSSKIGTHPHTATAMGNGQFPLFDDYGCLSGCVKRMRVRENSLDLRFPEFVNTYADEYNCYDVYYVEDYVEDPEFYYGGPGKSLRCP